MKRRYDNYLVNTEAVFQELLEACKMAEKTFRKPSNPEEEIKALNYLRKVITKATGKEK